MEGHVLAHISTRTKGDERVNECLDNILYRELQWSKKHSFTVQSETLYAIASAEEDETNRKIKILSKYTSRL